MHDVPLATYQKLFDLAPVGILITTPGGEILTANHALLSLSGYDESELRQRNAACLFADSRRREELRRRLARGDSVHDFEVHLINREGEERTCLLTAAGERDSEGQLERLLTIVHDITDYRTIQQELLEIGEEVRRRIGRELHDGPASTLSGLSLVVRGLIDKLDRGQSLDPDDLRRVSELVRQEAEETRTLSHELYVPELQDGSLLEALQTLRRSLEFLFGASCHLETEGALMDLPKEITLHLYRFAQEAAHNAGRHGDPRHIWIRLQFDEELVLTVADDGKGLPDDISPGEAGLHTLRYRAEVIGGRCEIHSAPEDGTSIACHLPRERFEQTAR